MYRISRHFAATAVIGLCIIPATAALAQNEYRNDEAKNPPKPTPAAPTGIVRNPSSAFVVPGTQLPAVFIFDTEIARQHQRRTARTPQQRERES